MPGTKKNKSTRSDSSANLGFEAKLWLANANQSRTLATLRDPAKAGLPKLLSGELSVAVISSTVEASG